MEEASGEADREAQGREQGGAQDPQGPAQGVRQPTVLLWVEPFMWAVCRALAYAMQFTGFFGLVTLAVAWYCTRMDEILED